MKNLFIIRHGKSSWELNVSDQDRPLNLRGVSDAKTIGLDLLKKELSVEAAFSSPANRAMHTAVICLQHMNFPLEKLTIIPSLYDFSGDKVVDFIKTLENNLTNVIVFGHNHAFTHIANALGNEHIDNVPTCGFVHLQFIVDDWANVTKGITKQTIFPKQL